MGTILILNLNMYYKYSLYCMFLLDDMSGFCFAICNTWIKIISYYKEKICFAESTFTFL